MKKFEYLKLFSISGVPVFMHWSMTAPLVILVMLAFSEFSLLIAAVSFFMIMLIHEVGHMWVASKLGLKPFHICLYLLHGRFSCEMANNEYHNSLVAWGGVVAQAVVFIPCIAIFSFYGGAFPWYINTILLVLGYVNALIAIMNVVPVMGMDGTKCWKAIPLYFKYRRPRYGREKKRKPQLKSIK